MQLVTQSDIRQTIAGLIQELEDIRTGPLPTEGDVTPYQLLVNGVGHAIDAFNTRTQSNGN